MENLNHQKSPKNRIPLFIIITSILLITVIVFYNKNTKLEKEKQQQLQEIASTYLKLDSLSDELGTKIDLLKQLGEEVDTLEALKNQLDIEKKELLQNTEYQKSSITKLNNRVAGYRRLLLQKDKQIKRLKGLNKKLNEENISLKVEKNQLNDAVRALEKNKKELTKKVAYASRLEVDNMQVIAINKRGKNRIKNRYKNNQISLLKIQFDLIPNEIAPIEEKELLLRIVAPDGNVLFDVARGSGSFTFENRELFYTSKQEILYERKSQQVSFTYNKGNDYASGEHKVEIYTDDYIIGQWTFNIK